MTTETNIAAHKQYANVPPVGNQPERAPVTGESGKLMITASLVGIDNPAKVVRQAMGEHLETLKLEQGDIVTAEVLGIAMPRLIKAGAIADYWGPMPAIEPNEMWREKQREDQAKSHQVQTASLQTEADKLRSKLVQLEEQMAVLQSQAQAPAPVVEVVKAPVPAKPTPPSGGNVKK
jgi:hypothetical protein